MGQDNSEKIKNSIRFFFYLVDNIFCYLLLRDTPMDRKLALFRKLDHRLHRYFKRKNSDK
jgi:hypothetical protein